MKDFVRLRQVALAVPQLAPVEAALRTIFELAPGHRDERVGRYGLENAVLALGPTFIEILAPTRPDTAVGRFLERAKDARIYGAYMAIFDCSDLARWRANIDALGIRVVNERRYEHYANLQLHPRDTGGTFAEIHQNVGGEELMGHYDPAGHGWQETVREDRAARRIAAMTFESPDPAALRHRWSQWLDRAGTADSLDLDYGTLRFRVSGDGGERLSALHIETRNPVGAQAAAKRMGCSLTEDGFALGGVRFVLVGAE